ncbi:unnamed protein product [Closterium sp. Yama58-4]|nr:unnamed protein product [Closterium sp. Yama58-4]
MLHTSRFGMERDLRAGESSLVTRTSIPAVYPSTLAVYPSIFAVCPSQPPTMADTHKPYRVLERGDIFFFYRPRVNREEAHSVDEVQRFYMLLRPLDSGERADGGGKAEEAEGKAEEAEGKAEEEQVGQALGVKEEGGEAANKEVAGHGDARKRARGDGEGDDAGGAEEEGLRRKQVKQEAVEEAEVAKGEEGEGEGEGKQGKREDEKKEEKPKQEEEEEKGVARGAGGNSGAEERAGEEGVTDERPPLRLLVVGRKLLPTLSHRSRPHWGYVDAVSPHVKDIRAALEGDTYETKTRGTQHVAAARAAAAGRYLIVSHVPGAIVSTRSSRKSHTHLVYSLRWPETQGRAEQAGGKEKGVSSKGNQAKGAEQVKEEQVEEQQGGEKGEEEGEQESPQKAFNIEREASYVLQVKNPQAPSRPPYLARPSVRLHAFPLPLQQRLDGLRFAPADPPAFLDHPGCEVLLIAASDDLTREFGGEVERDLAAGEGEGGEGEGELGSGEESGYGSGCEGDEWMGFVREGLGWQSEELVKPLEAGEWA